MMRQYAGFSIYVKSVLFILSPSILIAFGLSYYFIQSRIEYAELQLHNKGRLIINQLADAAQSFIISGNDIKFTPLVSSILKDQDIVTIQVIEMNYILSENLSQRYEDINLAGLLIWFDQDILDNRIGNDLVESQGEPKKLGQIKIALTNYPIRMQQLNMMKNGIFIAGICILFLIAIALWIARSIARPLVKLSHAVNKISENDYSVRVDVDSSGEIMQLQKKINLMAIRLQRLYQQNKRYVNELIHSKEIALSENQAKSIFLATMTHEIRTSMNGVLGMLQLLRTTQLDDIQKKYSSIAIQSGDYLLSIINNILDISKIEQDLFQLSSTYFNLYDTLFEIAEAVQGDLFKKPMIQFKSDIASTKGYYVFADLLRFKQVINNLLSNAIKFTQNGLIEFYVYMNDVSNNNKEIEIHINDTGIGIAKEDHQKVFDPFYQANERAFAGTGLGLNIAMKLVRLMDGSIELDANRQSGTSFIIKLIFPIKKEKEFQEAMQSSDIHHDMPTKLSAENVKLLLLEDNAVNIMIAKNMLEMMCCRVEVVSEAEQGFSLLSQKQYNIILLDLHLPGQDGYQVAQFIRQDPFSKNKKTPIIVMTADAFDVIKDRCFKLGVNDFLLKPYKQDELEKKIAFWIKQKE